jgi:hypothetical protein
MLRISLNTLLFLEAEDKGDRRLDLGKGLTN